MLEELDIWEGEDEEARVGLRWHRRELSKDCSDRYGAENNCELHRIRIKNSQIWGLANSKNFT